MLNERGVSEIIGAILLVSLVVLGVMIVAVLLLSQPPPQEIPQINAIAGNNTSYIFLRHDGGDPLDPVDTIIRIDGKQDPVPPDQILLVDENGNIETPWTTGDWSTGKTLMIRDNETPKSVSVVYSGGSSQALLLTATFVEAVPSVIPTLTPGFYHIITTSAGSGGSISPPGPVQVPDGGSQTFSITPNPCNRVTGVLVDGSPVGAVSTYTFTNVRNDHTISAAFAENTLAITASAGPNGAIIPSGTINALCHGTQPFSIVPSPGYYVLDVSVDGLSVGNVTSYTFNDIVVNHTISASFTDVAPCIPVAADFSGTPTTGDFPLTVQFTDLSTGSPTAWQWNFGDGTSNSTDKDPQHTYSAAGTYTVTLTASKSAPGCSSTSTKSAAGYVTVTTPTPACGTISGYKWNDLNGNGIWDTGEPGLAGWTINVSICNTGNCNSLTYLDSQTTNSKGYYIFTGLTYQPANYYRLQETLQPGWQQTYPSSGYQEVHLEPPGPGSVGQPPKCYAINVNFSNTQVSPPVPNFIGYPVSGTAPLTVQFTDQSTGNPTQWAWDVNNDGITDYTTQNPSHVYTSPGTYTVKLTATNAGGSNTIIKTGYITVSAPVGVSIYLSADKGGSLQTGNYVQFRVTGPYSYIKHGNTNYNLNLNDIVRLEITNDGTGKIYSTSTYMSDFRFNNVKLTINGVDQGTKDIGNNDIWISSFDSYVSTLTIVVPSENVWTYLLVNGPPPIIQGQDNRVITILNLSPFPGGVMNLDSRNDIYYNGGATGYTLT